MKKKFLTGLAVSVLMVACISSAEADDIITVSNADFEELVISNPGDWELNNIPDWVVSGQTATYRPGAGAFPGGVPEGVNVAAIGNNVDGGIVSQTLTASLEADTTYMLMVDVGNRLNYPFSHYMIELIAGDVTLASGSSLNPAAGTFLTDTIVFNSGSNPAQLGQNLAIQLSAVINGQADFDNVRLEANATPVPAPATILLFGTGLAGLVGTRMRKKKK